MHILDPENWGVGDLREMIESDKQKFQTFRLQHRREGCNWIGSFMVKSVTLPSTGKEAKRLYRLEHNKESGKKEPGRLVVPPTNIFSAIDEVHKSIGHKKVGATMEAVKPRFWNIIRDQVEAYVKLCPVCNQQQPRIRKIDGAIKPIVSDMYRDRFQVDLIDMRLRRMQNMYGVMMRWIVTLKDHHTRITWLAAIPLKKPSFVSHELQGIMGFIGYPSIYHTDNGTEVTSQEVVKMLKKINPSIITVTGRVRQPSDQGSVEICSSTSRPSSVIVKQRRGNVAKNLTGPTTLEK